MAFPSFDRSIKEGEIPFLCACKERLLLSTKGRTFAFDEGKRCLLSKKAFGIIRLYSSPPQADCLQDFCQAGILLVRVSDMQLSCVFPKAKRPLSLMDRSINEGKGPLYSETLNVGSSRPGNARHRWERSEPCLHTAVLASGCEHSTPVLLT